MDSVVIADILKNPEDYDVAVVNLPIVFSVDEFLASSKNRKCIRRILSKPKRQASASVSLSATGAPSVKGELSSRLIFSPICVPSKNSDAATYLCKSVHFVHITESDWSYSSSVPTEPLSDPIDSQIPPAVIDLDEEDPTEVIRKKKKKRHHDQTVTDIDQSPLAVFPSITSTPLLLQVEKKLPEKPTEGPESVVESSSKASGKRRNKAENASPIFVRQSSPQKSLAESESSKKKRRRHETDRTNSEDVATNSAEVEFQSPLASPPRTKKHRKSEVPHENVVEDVTQKRSRHKEQDVIQENELFNVVQSEFISPPPPKHHSKKHRPSESFNDAVSVVESETQSVRKRSRHSMTEVISEHVLHNSNSADIQSPTSSSAEPRSKKRRQSEAFNGDLPDLSTLLDSSKPLEGSKRKSKSKKGIPPVIAEPPSETEDAYQTTVTLPGVSVFKAEVVTPHVEKKRKSNSQLQREMEAQEAQVKAEKLEVLHSNRLLNAFLR